MSSNLEALFEAVLKNPDADAPRLAYAAACEAQGDSERAEFIRLQIDAAAAKRAGRVAEALQNVDRLMDLRDRFGDLWAGPIRDRVKYVQFFRGFVEKVGIDAKQFLDHADELYAMAPIRRLTLSGVSHVLEALVSSPSLSRIVWLNLEDQKIGDRGIELIAASPHVRRLAHLGLSSTGITTAGVEALAASPNLPSLRDVIGLPKAFCEDESWDQGKTIGVTPPPGASSIEQKYGYKRWLHPLEETKWRGIDEAEF